MAVILASFQAEGRAPLYKYVGFSSRFMQNAPPRNLAYILAERKREEHLGQGALTGKEQYMAVDSQPC